MINSNILGLSRRKLAVFVMGAATFGGLGCKPRSTPVVPPPPTPVPNLAPLGASPVWEKLSPLARSISREQVEMLLATHYCQNLAWVPHIRLEDDTLSVTRETAQPEKGQFTLPLATSPQQAMPSGSRYWRFPQEMPSVGADTAKPLKGIRIVLDPGHIGGNWAVMEERFFKPNEQPPIQEGSHTLVVAKLVQQNLQVLGASVTLVREKEEPVTPLRPIDFYDEAKAELLRGGIDLAAETAATRPQNRVKWNAEKLFYRTAEIRERARLVNDVIHPDLVVCLHFNAEGFGGGFTPANHFHMLLNGGFAQDEVLLDDQRFEMLERLLLRTHEAEIPLNAAVARSLQSLCGLPSYTYRKGANPIPNQPYLWARNLLANRLYRCPVAYCEPYVMNNQQVFDRINAGDYEGQKEIAGKVQGSIFREYAEGVSRGVRAYLERK